MTALAGALAASSDPAGVADGVRVWIGSVLDRLALRGMSMTYADLLEQRGDAAAAPATVAESFFAFLDEERADDEPVDEVATARLPGGAVHELRFASGYRAIDLHQRRAREAWVANRTIRAQHWRHTDGRQHPCVVLLHGFGMGAISWLDARVLCAPQWFARGFDVALLTLPLHGARCPADAARTGNAFASWDVAHVNESVRESVHDIVRLMRHLERTSGARVGLVGYSLGGYLAALTASLSSRPAFVVPIMAPVCLGDLPGRLHAMRRGDACTGDVDAVVGGYRVHSPLARPLAIPREHAVIVAARGDAFVPPHHARLLWEHWGRPALHWIAGGHLVSFGRGSLVAAIEAALAPGCFPEEEDALQRARCA